MDYGLLTSRLVFGMRSGISIRKLTNRRNLSLPQIETYEISLLAEFDVLNASGLIRRRFWKSVTYIHEIIFRAFSTSVSEIKPRLIATSRPVWRKHSSLLFIWYFVSFLNVLRSSSCDFAARAHYPYNTQVHQYDASRMPVRKTDPSPIRCWLWWRCPSATVEVGSSP